MSKVEFMDEEIVVAVQHFCNIFDHDHAQPDRMIILNIPHLVDVHYESDPIRSEIVKFSYKVRPIKTRVIPFQELVNEPETDSDSLYEVSFSTPDGTLRPKLSFDQTDEFSKEEISGDSAMKK